MATLTLDPLSALQTGLEAALWPPLQLLLPARDALRTGWPDPELSGAVATGTYSPVVSVWIGDYTLSKQQPSGGSARDLAGPITAQGVQTTLTTLVEIARLEAPVTFVIMAGGVRGRPTCSAVATAIVSALGLGRDIPLPDSYETEQDTDPSVTTFGQHARLVYVSEGAVHDPEEKRDLHTYQVRYRATQARYVATEDTLIQGVGLTIISAVGEGALEIPPPA